MDPRDGRPSPEALLKAAARENGRGRLKIFLGAAPGVGKTYEMLPAAQARRREGVDVVVGIVETHGRAETEALLAGLESVPRRAHRVQGPRRSRKWTSTPCWRAGRRWRWSTNWRTATRPAAATPSATWTSRNCWPPASTSARRSTSSTSKASTTSSPASPASGCARRCPTTCSTTPTTIEMIDITPDDLLAAAARWQGVCAAQAATRALDHISRPAT